MSKLAEQFAEMGRIARGFTPFEGRREMAIALCNAVGLRANDVTRLALTFEADGSTYIEATLFRAGGTSLNSSGGYPSSCRSLRWCHSLRPSNGWTWLSPT